MKYFLPFWTWISFQFTSNYEQMFQVKFTSTIIFFMRKKCDQIIQQIPNNISWLNSHYGFRILQLWPFRFPFPCKSIFIPVPSPCWISLDFIPHSKTKKSFYSPTQSWIRIHYSLNGSADLGQNETDPQHCSLHHLKKWHVCLYFFIYTKNIHY